MSAAGADGRAAAALGFRAVRGGGVAVGVALESGEPRVVLSSFLPTGGEGDRLSQEPYHVAYEMERGPDGEPTAEAAAVVAKGRTRQDELAAEGLAAIVRTLHDAGRAPARAALLVNRSGWLTDDLDHSLSWLEHVRIAEALAVRDALRFAFRQCGLEAAEMDEKSLPELASALLHLSSGEIDGRLKALGATAGRPWRKEQKQACLAAWVVLATRP